jgi:hypothetical protein
MCTGVKVENETDDILCSTDLSSTMPASSTDIRINRIAFIFVTLIKNFVNGDLP